MTLRLERPGTDEELPIFLTVRAEDGNWTPGPHATIEAGNVVEVNEAELAWLVEDAGPRALEALRGLAA